jgi:hypothetical protein
MKKISGTGIGLGSTAPLLRDTQIAWANGVRFRSDPQQVHATIEELDEQHGGYAPDGSLVAVARDPQNFLHADFEWDDEVAGDKYRLLMEKSMKRALVFISHSEVEGVVDSQVIRVLQRTSITDSDGGKRKVWRSTVDMLDDPQGREIMLASAQRELNTFVRKYQILNELVGVIAPIKKFLNGIKE